MRTSIGSYAIIKANIDHVPKYLMQLNVHRNAFNFISGHHEPIKDCHDHEQTIIREIEEELPGLIHKNDFYVTPLSRHPLKKIHYSERYEQMTSYEFYIFQFFFLKSIEVHTHLWEETPENDWFTLEEILEGAANNKRLISKFPSSKINAFLPMGLDGLPLSTIPHKSI